MTIKQASSKYGVSKQAIYQRLKKAGKPLDWFREPRTQLITGAGAVWLLQTYGKDKAESVNQLDSSLQTKIDSELKKQIESLKESNAAALAKVVKLQQQNDQLRNKLEQQKQMIETQAASISSLTASLQALTQTQLKLSGYVPSLPERIKRFLFGSKGGSTSSELN